MNRRKFLTILGVTAAAAATASYAYLGDETMKKAPKLEGKILADLHTHPSIHNPAEDLTEMLTGNVIGLAERAGNKETLTYEKALHLPNTREIELGLFAEITDRKDRKGYFVKAQEVEADFHILALGCYTLLPRFNDARKAVGAIHKRGGIAVLNHPCTVPAKGKIPYRIANEDDEKKIRELCAMVDEVEVFNAQNINLVPSIAWMHKANERAKEIAKDYNFNGTAASDAHLVLSQCGISGIYLPEENICMESIRNCIISGNFERREQYVSRLSFIDGMFFSK